MANPLEFLPGFEGMKTVSKDNSLWEYIQSQDPSMFQAMADESSPEVLEILGHNIRNLLGGLPPEQFGVQVMTSREGLAKMLSSAMMGGYLLRSIEQRLDLEKRLSFSLASTTLSSQAEGPEQPRVTAAESSLAAHPDEFPND
jgi:hypothetical protein